MLIHFNQSRRTLVSCSAVAIMLLCLVLALPLTAPVANAAARERCTNESSFQSLKINKKHAFDNHIPYGASWHWCWNGRKVTKFIVDNTWGQAAGVNVDIRPLHPLRWGPVYDIVLVGSQGKNVDTHWFHLGSNGNILQP